MVVPILCRLILLSLFLYIFFSEVCEVILVKFSCTVVVICFKKDEGSFGWCWGGGVRELEIAWSVVSCLWRLMQQCTQPHLQGSIPFPTLRNPGEPRQEQEAFLSTWLLMGGGIPGWPGPGLLRTQLLLLTWPLLLFPAQRAFRVYLGWEEMHPRGALIGNLTVRVFGYSQASSRPNSINSGLSFKVWPFSESLSCTTS